MRTSLYSILCIGIRLAAVLLAVNALLTLPAAYATFSRGEWARGDVGWMFALWSAVLLIALLLWVYPGAVARLAAGKASRDVFESPISADQLQYIAFSVVGLWLFAAGLISFVQMGIRELLVEHALRNVSAGGDGEVLRTRVIEEFLAQIVRIVVGSVLMLRARGLIGLLHRLRHAGAPPANGVEAASDATGTNDVILTNKENA